MSEQQEKEFSVFNFGPKLRRGFLIGIVSIQFIAIGYLYKKNSDLSKEMLALQATLYREMIQEVRNQVSPAVDKVTQAAIKVDSAAVKVDSVAQQQKGKRK